MNNSVVFIYNNPVRYPPTLNAINELAEYYDKVKLVCRSVDEVYWDFPENVCLINTHRKAPFSILQIKIFDYLRYIIKVLEFGTGKSTLLILAYDHLSLFPIFLFKRVMRKKIRYWYHSHDVIIKNKVRKFSFGNLEIGRASCRERVCHRV